MTIILGCRKFVMLSVAKHLIHFGLRDACAILVGDRDVVTIPEYASLLAGLRVMLLHGLHLLGLAG